MNKGYLLSLAMALTLLAAASPSGRAQAVIDREYDLKAAYLYNFGKFVDWQKNPVSDDNTFVIGVLGQDPFGANLATIAANKKIRDKTIVIRRFASAKDYQPCHILFISSSADKNADEKTLEDRVKAALAKTKGTPVLLVGDSAGLAQKGVMIGFFIEDNKVKMEINPDAATRAGLTINGKLLDLHQVVKVVKDSMGSTSSAREYYARIS